MMFPTPSGYVVRSAGEIYWTTTASTTSTTTGTITWDNDASTTSVTGWGSGGSIVWWNTQPTPTVYRRYQHPVYQPIFADRNSEPIYRPAIIRRRTVVEHARETVQRVHAVKDANAVKHRARRLLLSHLTQDQRRTFVENGWFIVEGGKSKQRYRIRDKNYAGNIDVLDGDRVAHRLCCHASADLPVADHLLAQKIMLEIAEDDFLRMANRHAA
jgi:hypothetical protein